MAILRVQNARFFVDGFESGGTPRWSRRTLRIVREVDRAGPLTGRIEMHPPGRSFASFSAAAVRSPV